MILTSEADITTHLRKSPLCKCYYIYGEEGYLVSRCVGRLLSRAVTKGQEAFSLHRFDGKDLTLDALEEAVGTVPFLSEKNCVLLRDPPLEKLSKDDMERLKALLSSLPEDGVLLFSMLHTDGSPKRSAKHKAIVELVGKMGCVCACQKKSTSELARFVREKVRRRGSEIDPGLSAYLIERVGDDMMTLTSDIEKLTSYCPEGEITQEMIDALTTRRLESSVFDLSRAVVANDVPKAFEILHALFDAREEPVSITGVLAGAFVDLYRAKTAEVSRRGVKELLASFDYKGRDFRVKNALRDSGKFTKEQLASILGVLSKADRRLKSAKGDKRIMLEQAVMELFACRAGGNKRC